MALLSRFSGFFPSSMRYLGFLYPIYSIGVFLPSIAVAVRRLHDIGRSGGWYFIALVPLVGPIVLLVFLLTKSDGENRYSPGYVPTFVVSPAAPGIPAGWLADPTGRHELRYWDSRTWTGSVSDAGVMTSDPL